MAGRLLMAVLLCCVIAGCNRFASEPEQTAREMLAAHAATTDQPAIVVPRTLPDGYGMVFANMYFVAGDAKLPGIEVCVAPSKRRIEGSCVGTADSSPWESFEVGNRIVVVSTVSDPEDAEFLHPWLDLDWTGDWENVPWIDTSFAQQQADG